MSALDDIAARQRAALLAGDRAVARELTQAWEPIVRSLRERLDTARARVSADPDAPLWRVNEIQRLEGIVDQAERRAATYGRIASRRTEAGARRAAREGLEFAKAGIDDVTPRGITATQPLAGSAVDSALAQSEAIRQTLGNVGDDLGASMRTILAEGIAAGQNPRVTARALAGALDLPAARARLVARTSMIGAHRSALMQTYRANNRVVRGWTWVSAADRRTCPACISMHGRTFPLSVPFESHPACRCTAVPEIVPYDELDPELGGVDPPEPIESGESLFNAMDEADQRAILGPGRLDAYNRGEFTFDRLASPGRPHPVYGTGIRPTPLRELVG